MPCGCAGRRVPRRRRHLKARSPARPPAHLTIRRIVTRRADAASAPRRARVAALPWAGRDPDLRMDPIKRNRERIIGEKLEMYEFIVSSYA